MNRGLLQHLETGFPKSAGASPFLKYGYAVAIFCVRSTRKPLKRPPAEARPNYEVGQASAPARAEHAGG
jgi:hypothetical protein